MKKIKLSQGKFAIIDDADFGLVSKYKWHFHAGYAESSNRATGTTRMHRLILNPHAGLVTDHINGNGLDNRRKNLRACLQGENNRNVKMRSANKSGYKGVHFCKSVSKFGAKIQINGRTIWLGVFDDPKEAHKAYCKAAIREHGEFAKTK